MKRSFLALAVFGACGSPAWAQSSVTLFGVVDAGARYVRNELATGSDARKTLTSDGLNSSRLGVRGTEDLGGGLRGGFWLEAALAPDVGTTQAKFWSRRATVSLLGPFGEVRLGRDYVPTFWNSSVFSVFATTGMGASTSVANFNAAPNVTPAGGTTTLVLRAFPTTSASGYVRNDNSIGYFLPPNIGGVYGQAMVAAGEGAAGKHIGGRIGWSRGSINVAAAYGRTDADAAGTTDFKVANVGASVAFGPVVVMGHFSKEKLDVPGVAADPEEKRFGIGARVAVGAGEVKASFVRSALDNGGPNNDDAHLIAVGYVHNLSKRTALYTTLARIDNKGVGGLSIPGGPSGQRRGGESRGADVGISHSF